MFLYRMMKLSHNYYQYVEINDIINLVNRYNETEQTLSDEGKDESTSSSDEDIGHASPTSMRLYLPKPRVPAQRRATITGASPISKRPPVNLDEVKKFQWLGDFSPYNIVRAPFYRTF